MAVHESGENYLETILILRERNGDVRSIDVANELGFSKPSVSRAMGILKSEKLITMDIDGLIKLTEEGEAKAGAVLDRHMVISAYLMKALDVESETATQDACRMEHDISEDTFGKMKQWLTSQAL
ncbi:MAG: metal-dependent transcriptional regulator [Clostridiales Family XIII bacterium]|jgi:Mn-dependent DtxR family transcriptional regulator|nr:metal-dependent transcriptional regulator [Clostridiales Family XIII bacterium]